MQNEIIIGPDKTRTIIGPLAHKLAFERVKAAYFSLEETERYHVFEHNGDRWVHRAGQSTRKGAEEYMRPGRVLVWFQGNEPYVERPFHNNDVRVDQPHIKQFTDNLPPPRLPESSAIENLRVGCKILIDTMYGASRASITGWRWPELSVDPVSVLLLHDNGSMTPYTFGTFSAFKQAYRGKYSS